MDKSQNEAALSGEGLALSSRSSSVDLTHAQEAGTREGMDSSQQHTSAEHD